ncbi:hypothetical protein MRX96_014132 [Rhipicephalus microplus]
MCSSKDNILLNTRHQLYRSSRDLRCRAIGSVGLPNPSLNGASDADGAARHPAGVGAYAVHTNSIKRGKEGCLDTSPPLWIRTWNATLRSTPLVYSARVLFTGQGLAFGQGHVCMCAVTATIVFLLSSGKVHASMFRRGTVTATVRENMERVTTARRGAPRWAPGEPLRRKRKQRNRRSWLCVV